MIFNTFLKVDAFEESGSCVFISPGDLEYLESIRESSPFKDKRHVFEKRLSGDRILRFHSVDKNSVSILNVEDISGWCTTHSFEEQHGIENFMKDILQPQFSLREVLKEFDLMSYGEMKQIGELANYIFQEYNIHKPDKRWRAEKNLDQKHPNLSRRVTIH